MEIDFFSVKRLTIIHCMGGANDESDVANFDYSLKKSDPCAIVI